MIGVGNVKVAFSLRGLCAEFHKVGDWMNDLPMPSDVRKLAATQQQAADAPVVVEPPSVKLIVRLFIIPLLIAAAVVGIMIPIGRMAGGPVSLELAIRRLKEPGGERTLGMVGPGSKQRYMDAKALVDHMKGGLSEAQRIKLAGELTEILERYTTADEGEVQHFVLLALGRVWQKDPGQEELNSPAAVASREASLKVLMKYFDSPPVMARKAAMLALGFWGGQPEARQAIPILITKLGNAREDLDVRMAASSVLGNLALPSDAEVIEALNLARSDTEPKNAELVWNAAGALAQLHRPEAAPTLMKLLSRDELAKLQVYDRETDPQNPVMRELTELEKQRFLINAMERARFLDTPEIQNQLKIIKESDPAIRVRMAATEMLSVKSAEKK